MDKLKLAHEYAMKHIQEGWDINYDVLVVEAWQYADAMQAEADKRKKAEASQKRKEIREMLNAPNTFVEREGQHFDDVADIQKPYTSPEALCEVDWSAAPKNAFQWQMINNEAYWRIEIMGGLDTEPAPSFSFTGSHIVERPDVF